MNSDSKPIRIFLVDDNPNDRFLMRYMLNQCGADLFQVEEAWNLDDTLERLLAGGIDLLLLDMNLPDSRGVDTLARIRETYATLPVIVFSGVNDGQAKLELDRLGAKDFLIKGTFDAQVLLRAIQNACGVRAADTDADAFAP